MHSQHHLTWINGPAGRLQTIYLPAKGTAQGVAVLNHPNPLHGGTFTNKVIQTAAKALSELGFHCYLPNLRGVGESEGSHDYGQGETDDCLSVVDYAAPNTPKWINWCWPAFLSAAMWPCLPPRAANPMHCCCWHPPWACTPSPPPTPINPTKPC